MVASQWLVWNYAPLEASLGLTQKILYCHVPLAWWALASFVLAAVGGGLYLRTRRLFWDNLSLAAVESGVLFAGLAIATGMLWAKPAWGVWWTGDPRLTSFLILWFMYAGCLVLRRTVQEQGAERGRKATVAAVLSIVACVNVPLVFLSTRLLRSAHPTVLGKGGGGLEPEMLLTLLVCVAAMGLVWLGLLLLRLRLAQLGDACARAEYACLCGADPRSTQEAGTKPGARPTEAVGHAGAVGHD